MEQVALKNGRIHTKKQEKFMFEGKPSSFPSSWISTSRGYCTSGHCFTQGSGLQAIWAFLNLYFQS